MGYKVKIQNEQGEPIPGDFYLFDANGYFGWIMIPKGGATLSDADIKNMTSFKIESDGYAWYGGSTLYDENVFTLIKNTTQKTGLLLAGGAVAAYLLIKLLKL